MVRVSVGSGNLGLNAQLVDALKAAGHDAEACTYGAAVTGREADAAVVGASLATDGDAGILSVIVPLRQADVRVVYLPGRRDQVDDGVRELLVKTVALGVYDILFDDELTPDALVAVLGRPPRMLAGLGALRRPGDARPLLTSHLGTALQKVVDEPPQPVVEQTAASPPPERVRVLKSVLRRQVRVSKEQTGADMESWRAAVPAFHRGVTSFFGALPGCGCTGFAIAYALTGADDGDVLLVDAHFQRAHMAHYLLGRHLSTLVPEDRARSWRHCQGHYREAVLQIRSGLQALLLAFEPSGSPQMVAASCDVAVRWGVAGADVEINARPGRVLEETRRLLDHLGAGGNLSSVVVRGSTLTDHDRALWAEALGVAVPAGDDRATPREVADLERALRACANGSPVIDFGSMPPIIAGRADGRVSWAARQGSVVVVTRPDTLGQEAAERMERTVLAECPDVRVEIVRNNLAPP